MNPEPVRIDKWLWAVRLYKTRSLATEACRQGRVRVAGQPVKPAREIRLQDVVVAQTGDLTRTFRALAILDRRVGAAALPGYVEDLTPPAEYEKRRDPVLQPLFARLKGQGRPTKRDRRRLEEIL